MAELNQFLTAIGTLGVLVFIITSMLGMGLNLAIPQIAAALKNTRLILLSLAANFVIIPLLALLIVWIIPLSQGLQVGLILVGMAAGATFLPKLVQVAKGDLAFTAGLMIVLMVTTIFYLPIVLPFVLEGVQVDPWDIAKNLILLMLVPLAMALYIRARYEELAIRVSPIMTMATNLSLVVMFVAYFVAYYDEIIGSGIIGTNAIMAAIILIVGAAIVGYMIGGKSIEAKKVISLGTAQRNLSAAFAIAISSFRANPDVLIEILVLSSIGFIILMLIAEGFGRQSKTPMHSENN